MSLFLIPVSSGCFWLINIAHALKFLSLNSQNEVIVIYVGVFYNKFLKHCLFFKVENQWFIFGFLPLPLLLPHSLYSCSFPLIPVTNSPSLLGDVGGVICKFCNLSIPFHGCLLDFGTCRTKPGQYCIKEILTKGKSECLEVSRWSNPYSIC